MKSGDYTEKIIQVVPHITDAIQEWIEKATKSTLRRPKVYIIELGRTIGDIETIPFVEALQEFQFHNKKENFACVHLSQIPQLKTMGELKIKLTQCKVMELRKSGLSPNLLICRSELPIGEEVKNKIFKFCHKGFEHVITIHDVFIAFEVPQLLESQGMVYFLNNKLQLDFLHSDGMILPVRTETSTSIARTLEQVIMLVSCRLDLKDLINVSNQCQAM